VFRDVTSCHTAMTVGRGGRGFVWRGGNGVSSSRRCIAASAWLLAAGLLVSAGGATAFADPGAGGTKGAGSSSAAKGNGVGGGSGPRRSAATAGASRSGHGERGMTSGVRQRSALQPRIDESDPVTKSTTLITRSATVALGAHQFSTDADSVTDSTSANDVARSGDETGPTEESTLPIDAGPTSEVASPPTTNEVQPSPTGTPPADDPAPSPVASTEVTSDTAVPVIPVNDASESGSGASGSDPTTASTAPTVVAQGTSQGASGSSDTASGPNQTPSDTGVTTVLEALLTPTTEPVATPAVPVDVAPVLETIVNTVELMSDDENAQRRSDHDRPALSPLQILRLMTQTSGSSLAGEATEIPTLLDGSNQTRSNSAAFASGTNGALAGTSSTTPVVARIQPDAALPEGLQTFLHTYGGIIVAVSLSAMFAAALPGLIGLAIPVAAGMGIGYRQAKAGRALHTSGIAHLAPSGPIGVVRSGRLIALRSPGRRVPTPNNADLAQEVA
jgi:hypothetical protein